MRNSSILLKNKKSSHKTMKKITNLKQKLILLFSSLCFATYGNFSLLNAKYIVGRNLAKNHSQCTSRIANKSFKENSQN